MMTLVKDYAEQIRGVSYKPEDVCEELNDESITLLRANNITDSGLCFDDLVYVRRNKVKDVQKLQKGDVLICTSSGSKALVGKAAYVTKDMDMAFGAFCKVIRPHGVNTDYFQYFFQSPAYRKRISELAAGANINNIRNEHIDGLAFYLPDISTQRRIADTLDKVSEGIGLCRKILGELDLMVKAKFGEMFGDAHNNSAFPYKNIGDLTTVTSGGTPDRENNLYWDDGNIRWVKTTELQNCTICDTEEKITKLGLENSSAKLVPAGSVLIAMYGQGKTRGMTAYLENESATNQACACILPSSKINQKYLWKYLMLSYDKLRSMAKGGNQPNLNIGIIKNFPVLYPPIELQNQYVEFVIYIDKSILTIKGILAKMEEMKLALMQKCFKEGKHGE